MNPSQAKNDSGEVSINVEEYTDYYALNFFICYQYNYLKRVVVIKPDDYAIAVES